MRVVVHVSTLIERAGKLLFVREKRPHIYGKYNLPGGHLEKGEDILAGARREVAEEVGFTVELAGFLGVYEGASDNHYINFAFYAQASAASVAVPQEGEILDCHWLSLEDIAAIDDSLLRHAKRIRPIIEDFRQGRIYPLHLFHRL